MLKRIFRKKGERLFLGSITVVPRKDLKRHFEPQNWFNGEEKLSAALQNTLEQIFDLPDAKAVEHPKNTDLAIDVLIPKYQSGSQVTMTQADVFVFWRPKIEIAYRLYNLKSGKTLGTATVKVKPTWAEFFSRTFSLQRILGFKPLFDSDDINQLLGQACVKLLVKLKKATS